MNAQLQASQQQKGSQRWLCSLLAVGDNCVLMGGACFSWKAPLRGSSANEPSGEGMSRSFSHGYESLSTTFTISLLAHTRVTPDPRWHLGWMRCIINGRPIAPIRVDVDLHSHPKTQGDHRRVLSSRS